VLEPFRPTHYREVARFARKLENFWYVRHIIKWHAEGLLPGECFVWREDGRVAAFQAIGWLDPDDAWLWGMRVDPAFQGRGIATRFTRALLPVIRKTGRTWVGLNTLDHRTTAPTFSVMDKLGFRLEGTFATDVYWRRPRGEPRPRLARHQGIVDHWRQRGLRVVFRQKPGWLYSRILPARRARLDRNGFTLDGVPLHFARFWERSRRGRRFQAATVNWYDEPADFGRFARLLLASTPPKGYLTMNYPVEWAPRFRAGARAAMPGIRKNRGCWQSAWRIYGRRV
jgi:RimJ/RimL family protein N-acetyltransferase